MPPAGTDDTDTNDDAEPTKNILIQLPENERDSLQETKNRHGWTWKGMLRYAQRSVWREEQNHECRQKAHTEENNTENGQ